MLSLRTVHPLEPQMPHLKRQRTQAGDEIRYLARSCGDWRQCTGCTGHPALHSAAFIMIIIPKPRNTRLLLFGKTHKPFYVHSGGMNDDKQRVLWHPHCCWRSIRNHHCSRALGVSVVSESEEQPLQVRLIQQVTRVTTFWFKSVMTNLISLGKES